MDTSLIIEKYSDNDIVLSDEQQKAFDALLDFFDGRIRELCIEGTPGTGKTFITCMAIGVMRELKSSLFTDTIACVFPSHRAKRIAQQNFRSQGISVDVYTAHSFLGLTPDVDEENGKRKFKGKQIDRPCDMYDFVWADEASMYNTDISNMLYTLPSSLLITGDRRQLLPVKENDFPLFKKVLEFGKHYVLQEPQRYAGFIKDFVYDCIEFIDEQKCIDPRLYLQHGDGLTKTRDWFSEWKQLFGGHDNTMLLTYTNRDVDTLNRICRDYVLGGRSKPLQAGEKVIAYSPICDRTGKIMISNGSELIVEAVELSEIKTSDASFEALQVKFVGVEETCLRVTHNEQDQWIEYVKDVATKCKKGHIRWGYYYHLISLNADFKPLYAMSIHKSQGSGWKNVFLIDTFKWLKDGVLQPRLYYVAASRAKEHLIYCNKLYAD